MIRFLTATSVLAVLVMAQSGMAGILVPNDSGLLADVVTRAVGVGALGETTLQSDPATLALLVGGLMGLVSAGTRADRRRLAPTACPRSS